MRKGPLGDKRVLCRNLLIAVSMLAAFCLWRTGIRLEHLGVVRLLFAEPRQLSAAEDAEVRAWLQEEAIPLGSVNAGSGFDDLMPLKEMLGDARIVSLGENAHLNGDFYKVKHRLVEFLVTEMGFTVFAIEAPFGCASKINAFLGGGEMSPQEALEELVYKVWRTEEVLNMLIWMREYNTAHDRKVTFYGFDDRPVFRCAKVVYDYIRRVDDTDEFDAMLAEWITQQSDRSDHLKLQGVIGEVRALVAYLDSQRPTATQDYADWDFAVQNARVLLQHVEFFLAMPDTSKASDIRDKHMAENVQWIIGHENVAKTILWAANPHITILPGSGCMGDHLRRAYGDDMVTIALLCNGRGTLEEFLAAAGPDICLIDFRSLPKGIVSEYLNAPFRSDQGVKTIYPLSYDAVLYLESTSDARMIERQDFLYRSVEM